MNASRTAFALPLCAALLASLLVFDAQAASAQQRYLSERAACLNGSSSQDRATCLKEAGAALAEARKSRQPEAQPDYRANALLRCDRQPEADRLDCRRLVLGAGSSSGSVAEGAVVRELVTRTVSQPGSAASAP
nr:hypothetical protein [uncultured Roseateles sp.]